MEILSTQLIKRLSAHQTNDRQRANNNLFRENKEEYLQKIATAIPPQLRTVRVLDFIISRFTLLKPRHISIIDLGIDALKSDIKFNSYIPKKRF